MYCTALWDSTGLSGRSTSCFILNIRVTIAGQEQKAELSVLMFFLGKQHPKLDEFGISYLFLLHFLKLLESNSELGNPLRFPKDSVTRSAMQLQLKTKWCMWTRERNSS